MICKKLDEDDVRELLLLVGGAPVVLIPLPEHLVETQRERLAVDEQSVLLRHLEGLRDEVPKRGGTDESVGVEVRGIDLL